MHLKYRIRKTFESLKRYQVCNCLRKVIGIFTKRSELDPREQSHRELRPKPALKSTKLSIGKSQGNLEILTTQNIFEELLEKDINGQPILLGQPGKTPKVNRADHRESHFVYQGDSEAA